MALNPRVTLRLLDTVAALEAEVEKIAASYQDLGTHLDRECREADRRRRERDEARAELRRERKKNENSLGRNLCPDHRDKQAGKPCLACQIERLEGELRERDQHDAEEVQRYRSIAGDAQVRIEPLTESVKRHREALRLAHEAIYELECSEDRCNGCGYLLDFANHEEGCVVGTALAAGAELGVEIACAEGRRAFSADDLEIFEDADTWHCYRPSDGEDAIFGFGDTPEEAYEAWRRNVDPSAPATLEEAFGRDDIACEGEGE